MKRMMAPLLVLCACAVSSAQDMPVAMGDYNKLSIPRFGIMKLTFEGQLKLLGEGVEIRLMSDDPEVKELPIEAETITFSYAEGQASPTSIVMQGKVFIDHPQATVRAEKASWDFNKGTLIFSGNPIVSNAMVKEMRAETVTIDFNAGTLEATRGRVDEYQMNQGGGGAGAPASPFMLSESDVTDWAGLIEALKSQGKAGGASPGKQVISLLGSQAQGAISGMSTEALTQQKGLLIKELNSVLGKPGLYSEAAWSDITLGDDAQALLKNEKRTADEQIQLNRLLLQAAFPDFIKRS